MGNKVWRMAAFSQSGFGGYEALGWCSLGSAIRDIDVSPDQTRALACSREGLHLWEFETGRQERVGAASGSARACRWSLDGQHIAVGFDAGEGDERLQVLGADTGDCQAEFVWPAERPCPGVNAVAFSPDNCHVFAAAGHRVLMWPILPGVCCDTLEDPCYTVSSVQAGAASGTVACGSGDGGLYLWWPASGNVRRITAHEAAVTSVWLSEDGNLALSGGGDGALRLWALRSGACLRTLTGHVGIVNAVCMSADGRLALSGGDDQSVRLWDLTSGRNLATYVGHSGAVNAVRLITRGDLALSAGEDGALRLWDAKG